MDLQRALGRADLEPRTRLLVLAKVAIMSADWPAFRAAIDVARELPLLRSEFEEMLLQATLFFGFPRVVSAFEQLAATWPAAGPPGGGEVPVAERRDRGRALFASIYGRNDETVRAMLASFHSAFHDFVIEAAYGRILSRPGLDPRTRELLAVAALAALSQVPQLVAHARGAFLFGASRAQIREAIFSALGDEHATDALLRRV